MIIGWINIEVEKAEKNFIFASHYNIMLSAGLDGWLHGFTNFGENGSGLGLLLGFSQFWERIGRYNK